MPKQVHAWLTDDGQIFKTRDAALDHEKAIQVQSRLRKWVEGTFDEEFEDYGEREAIFKLIYDHRQSLLNILEGEAP
jgi:hypothetical protein